MDGTPQLGKSQFAENPTLSYCVNHSYKLLPIQQKLMQATLKHPRGMMMGAVEVIELCTILMKQLKTKNCLDVGMFTGFSAVAWALAIPEDGRVVTMDVSDEAYNECGKQLVEQSGVSHKIDIRIQPAVKTMDELIASGQSGQFDFAFIDAEKSEYPAYYERCMKLLRPGGFIAIDNALGALPRPKPEHIPTENGEAKIRQWPPPGWMAIDDLNKIIIEDSRVNNILLPIAQGLNLVFIKK